MLTTRSGAAGSSGTAKDMAEYMVKMDVPELQDTLSTYYAAGTAAAQDLNGATIAMPRRDMDPALATLLGIDTNRNMRVDEVAGLLAGNRTDNTPIPGRSTQNGPNGVRLAFTDFVLSAPKSFSVALAFAETQAERAVLDLAHMEAVDRTMAHIASEIGLARKGNGGCDGTDPASVGWVSFQHHTARPVSKVVRMRDGSAETELVTVNGIPGDPQRHTHTLVFQTVVTKDGRVGSLDLSLLTGQIKTWGSLYQAFLATSLRAAGINAKLDPMTGTAYLPAIPKRVSDAFSKRTWESDDAAKQLASARGLDWETMDADAKVRLLKTGAMSTRNSKQDGLSDYATWHAEAKAMGYEHKSVLNPGRAQAVPVEEVQIPTAWEAGKKLLAAEFYGRAKLEGSIVRTMAARSLIESGIHSPADIDKVTAAFRTRGIEMEGKSVPLLWAKEEGQKWSSVTTGMHVDQENEAIKLLKAAAADRSSDLSPKAVQDAVDRFLASNPHMTLDTDHGKAQRAMIDRLAASGRAAMGVGAAGSGKTSVVQPLVDAWKADGRDVYGVTLAWRQTQGLADAGITKAKQPVRKRTRLEPDTRNLKQAGISDERTMAMARFLKMANEGRVPLDRNSVVVLDEAATIGTRQLLQLARLQSEHGFQFVALGDDKQVAAIEHGNSVRMFRKALGAAQVPEIATTVRQDSERNRVTATLFREGKADEALARKQQDGTLLLVPGNAEHAILAAVDLLELRQRENAHDPKYRIGISVPTNADVKTVGAEVRRRRQAAGEIGPDQITIPAQDQMGKNYDLPLTNGDRVRLFGRAYAVGGGMFGDNGTVAEIEGMDTEGLTLRRMDNGRSARVRWDSLKDPDSQRVRLTYGDAMTIDTRQGETLTEHILLMPVGSQAVNGFKGYSGESRHRKQSWIVTSQGAEQQEVVGRRALGDPRPVAEEDLVLNMGRNLSRQPEKELATDFLDRAETFRRGTVRDKAAADFGKERRQAQGRPATNAEERKTERQTERDVVAVAEIAAEAIRLLPAPLRRLTHDDKEARTARRTMKQAAERPKATPTPTPRKEPPVTRKPISEVDALGEFADALSRAGFRLRGAPIMDGKMRRVAVDGDKGTKKSGTYVGYSDGTPAGYIHNFKTGEEIRWKASASTAPLTDGERAKLAAAMEATRRARDAERRALEEATSRAAERVWAQGKPVVSHPYLARKDVGAHNVRVDNRGRLLVPMRDADGKLWNLQTISEDGTKLFMKGRKRGTFAVLGEMKPGAPIAMAEGYATAATIRETTGLVTIAAFDSGNLGEVATALRAADATRPIVFVADNDHHAPRREKPLANVGMEKAVAAAASVGGIVLLPEFAPSDPGTDWNDKAAQIGRPATRELAATELGKHGIVLPSVAARNATVSQAARDAARQRVQSQPVTDAAARAAAEVARQAQQPRGPVA